MFIPVRYVLLSTEPSAFKNSDDVPPVLTKLPAVNAPVTVTPVLVVTNLLDPA